MAYTLTSANLPIPNGPNTTYLLSNATTTTGNAPETPCIAQGDTSALLTKLNGWATRIDITATYGCGYGVLNGLTLTYSGLVVTVASGQAQIYGIVELSIATTITVPDATAHVYLWLKSNGTLTYTTTTTAPQNDAVYIGHVVTSGGAVTSKDYSGVVYLIGGQAVRNTADTTKPVDSPSSNTAFWTLCPGGTFLWDGTEYTRMFQAGKSTFTATGSVSAAQALAREFNVTGAGGYTLTMTPNEGEWVITNDSSGSVTMSDGTNTVTIATGKSAIIRGNGTRIRRITSDA